MCVCVCLHVCNCVCQLLRRVSVWFEAKETRHHELRFHSSLYGSIYLSPWGRWWCWACMPMQMLSGRCMQCVLLVSKGIKLESRLCGITDMANLFSILLLWWALRHLLYLCQCSLATIHSGYTEYDCSKKKHTQAHINIFNKQTWEFVDITCQQTLIFKLFSAEPLNPIQC